VACASEAVASRVYAVRRLGAMLNEIGHQHLRQADLSQADGCFIDAFGLFTRISDAVNGALLLLNRAAVARQRAARHAQAFAAAANAVQNALKHPASQTQLSPSDVATAKMCVDSSNNDSQELMPDRGEARHLLDAVEHQRAAHRLLQNQREQQSLRAMVTRDLAAGEAMAGNALHAIIAETGGDDAMIKQAGECLSNAQTLYEELGELAQVQLMMRRQGSLYLAATLCIAIDGATSERAVSARLTLAQRHYERALAPALLSQASASPAMERCAAEARLELINFYLSWSEAQFGGEGKASGGGARISTRIKHLESALSHARASPVVARAPQPSAEVATKDDQQAKSTLPTELVNELAEVERRVLRELIKAYTAQGNTTRTDALKFEYRRLLKGV